MELILTRAVYWTSNNRMHYRNSVKKNAYNRANQKLQSQSKITNSVAHIATLTKHDNIGIAIIRNQHINEDLYIGKNKINILNK